MRRANSRRKKLATSRARAKVFWSGRSQAVRLPKEFRFDTAEVFVHRDGKCLVLEAPTIQVDARGWPIDFADVFGAGRQPLDLGDRTLAPERPDPLGGGY